MRKLVVSEFLSLDGVMGEPEWSVPYINEEQKAFKFNELLASDALLLGRVTYQGFADAWPSITDNAAGLPTGFSDRMNSLPKFIASNTLKEPLDWNATLLKGDLVKEISNLKQKFGQDILVTGSAELAYTLMQNNLVDEYRFLVYPVVVGNGKRFFKDQSNTKLKLVESKSFTTGIVVLIYQPE